MAVAEAAARAMPPTAIETTPTMGGMEGIMAKRPLDAAAVAVVAAHAMPPMATKTMPAMGGMEGIMAEGPLDIMAVAEETDRELSLALPSEGRHPPMSDEPPF